MRPFAPYDGLGRCFGTTFPATVGAYVIGGTGAGLVLGLLRPLCRPLWGVAFVGFLCAIPVWVAGFCALNGLPNLSWEDVRAAVILSLVSGPICALVVRKRLAPQSG